MILNNLIYDHGLELPDVADFPGVGEVCYPGGITIDGIYDSFSEMNYSNFTHEYISFIDKIKSKVNFSDMELSILKEQTKRVLNCIHLYFDSCHNQISRKDLLGSELYRNLEYYGSGSFKLEPGEISNIRTELSHEIDELLSIQDHDSKPHFYDRFYSYGPANKPSLFDLINKIFMKYGVFEAASKYNQNKRNLKLHTIALHVATPTDTHHYQTLQDLPTTSKLISLHMDPKFNLMKSLLYLSDVDEDSGPFTVVPESNRWYYPPLERIVACGNSTGNYLNSESHRKVMLSMPKIFRKNVILGRMIPDNTPTSDMLLKRLYKYTSDKADCIIFDPTQTLHRGGLCKNKNRINLQILMR